MKKKPLTIVFSCEHAVDTIPSAYQAYFKEHQALLKSHRGIDFGAAAIAESLHQALGYPLHSATTSRFLIDCNRTLYLPGCFSEASLPMPEQVKQQLIDNYYTPYRHAVITLIQENISQGYQVLHLSIHSFTASLEGVMRQGDIGLLYDPKRPSEKNLVYRWQRLLKSHAQEWRTRLNYPYQGRADGFTTTLRGQFPDSDYLGVEVESNQALSKDKEALARLEWLYATTLRKLMTTMNKT